MKKEYTPESLIDAYLKDTITKEDNFLLKHLIQTDPKIATLFNESEVTFRYLQYARDQHIKRKLRAYDKGEINLQESGNKWWIMTMLLILSAFAGLLVIKKHFHFQNIAKRNIIEIKMEGTDLQEAHFQWNKVETYLQKDDFENAA